MAAAEPIPTVSDDKSGQTVYGNNDGDDPTTDTGISTGNTLTITTTGKVENAYGASNTTGQNASNNTLIINGTVTHYAKGGYATGGNTIDNVVEISGTVNNDTWGGHTLSGNAQRNHVTVKNGGKLNLTAIGGESQATDGIASDNDVTIEGTGSSALLFTGGRALSGTVENNNVYVNGGTILLPVGGQTNTGTVQNNHVYISGGSVTNAAYGGLSTTGLVDNNDVNITGGEVNSTAGGISTSGNITNNTVNVDGGTINHTSMTGWPAVAGGYSAFDSNITNNTVNIISGKITSGTADSAVAGGFSTNGDATYNTVNLYDLDGISDYINGTIQGGRAGAGKSSTNNTLNFIGTANIPLATLDGDTIQTINVWSKDNHVQDITGNVKNMNFYMPAGTAANETMLTIDNATADTNLNGTKYYVTAQSGLTLDVGNEVTLIINKNKNLTTDTDLAVVDNVTVTAPAGITPNNNYTFSIEKKGTNAIIATVRAKTTGGGGGGGGGGSITVTPATPTTPTTPTTPATPATPATTPTTPTVTPPATPAPVTPAPSSEPTALPQRTRSLSETRASMTTLLNGGSDFLMDKGMDEAESVAIDPEISVVYGRLVPFAVLGGGSLDIDSGAQVDLKTFYANLGLTKEIKNRQGSLYLGPIFEYGRGNYDSYMDNGVHGWGTGHYTGAGFFARQRNHDGLYYEGDVRIGRVTADYKGVLADGLYADYTTSGTYIAAHLGIGKIFPLNKKDTLDTYLKYFFSHTNSDDVNVHSNLDDETFHFDSVNSHRLRIGARYYHALNERSKLYAGLAYQYEFNGEARGSHNGLCTPAPSLRGGSGMAELGWQAKPSKDSPMTVDLGVTGWAGKQQGVMGRLKVSWSF